MTLNEQLNSLVNRYEEFLQIHSFVLVNELKSGMGLLKDYANDKLKLRFINDRGICEVLVADPNNEKNTDYFDLCSIRLLNLHLNEQLYYEQIRKNSRFSAKNDCDFILREYPNLVELFKTNELPRTKATIDKIRTDRVKIKYGN